MHRRDIALLLLVAGLASCDTPGRLIAKNRSDAPMRIRFAEHPNPDWPKRGLHGSVWANTEPHVFTVNLPAHKHTDLTLCGPYSEFGWRWDSAHVYMYASRLDRIDVITENDSTAIVDQAHLRDLFWKGRRGLFKQTTVLQFR